MHLKRALATGQESQWVRASVGGLISDVRLVGVTTEGVNLEVMVLEQTEATQCLRAWSKQ